MLDFIFGPDNIDWRLSVPITSVPFVKEWIRIQVFYNWEELLCLVSFLLFGRGAELPSSAWSFHMNENSGREQIEFVLQIALYLSSTTGFELAQASVRPQ